MRSLQFTIEAMQVLEDHIENPGGLLEWANREMRQVFFDGDFFFHKREKKLYRIPWKRWITKKENGVIVSYSDAYFCNIYEPTRVELNKISEKNKKESDGRTLKWLLIEIGKRSIPESIGLSAHGYLKKFIHEIPEWDKLENLNGRQSNKLKFFLEYHGRAAFVERYDRIGDGRVKWRYRVICGSYVQDKYLEEYMKKKLLGPKAEKMKPGIFKAIIS